MGQHDLRAAAPDLDTIDRVRREHIAAVNRGDAEAWASTFRGLMGPDH